MAECTNTKLGEMLYAYELGMLSDADKEAVEVHILECSNCNKLAQQFGATAQLLRDDSDVQMAARTSEGADSSKFPDKAATHRPLKPYRYLALAAVILLVAAPAYWLWQTDGERSSIVQQINLTPVRNAGKDVLYIDSGGVAEIRFVIDEASSDRSYDVSVSSRSGEIVYRDDAFSDFDDSGTGLITLSVERFEPGFYRIRVSDPRLGTDEAPVEFYFRAELRP